MSGLHLHDHGLPVLFAVFVWWFSTGIVLLLDGLPRTTFRWSHLVSSLLAVGGLGGPGTALPAQTDVQPRPIAPSPARCWSGAGTNSVSSPAG